MNNITIPIEVSGDLWYNEVEVQQKLKELPGDVKITLDLRSEGPSLHRLGITTAVDAWLSRHNLSPDTVTVTRWSNSGESVPYTIFECSMLVSHFMDYTQHYQHKPEYKFGGTNPYLFGLFLGRATIHRNVIMYQVQQQWADRFLISRLSALTPEGAKVPEPWHTHNFKGWRLLETLADWAPGHEQDIIDWFGTQTFTSLDSRTVRDQFGDINNHFVHNRSMLSHYHRFNIELVCESYTLGQTFFPTEKTARPIAGTRPWIIYAAPGYIQGLKRMGFRSFDSVWDESYDQLEGPARWTAMKTVIQSLIDLDSIKLNLILEQAHEIALYNRLHLETVQLPVKPSDIL
jgi:hypothetical protein